nr:hypothetical protein [Clostridia bacterium]
MTDRYWYEPYMTDGEKLLWQGKPAENAPTFCKEDAKSLLFLPFLGMGGFMLYTIASSGAPGSLLMGFGAVIGVWVLGVLLSSLGPTLYRLWLQGDMAYAVTDRRILRYRRGTVDALDVAHLPKGRVLPTKDGCGTVTFAMEKTTAVRVTTGSIHFSMSMPQDWLSGMLRTSMASLDGFELFHIPEAEQVLALIRSIEPSIPDVPPLTEAPLLPLEPGEVLLWQGKPETPPIGFDYDWLNIMPGFFVAGIGAVGQAMLSLAAAPVSLRLIFVIPIVVGLFLLFGRALLQRIRMGRTTIVITDRRILRSVGGKVKELKPSETLRMGLFQGRDGCGTVILGDVWAAAGAARNSRNPSLTRFPGFQLMFIPDAAKAMDAVNALRKHIAA